MPECFAPIPCRRFCFRLSRLCATVFKNSVRSILSLACLSTIAGLLLLDCVCLRFGSDRSSHRPDFDLELARLEVKFPRKSFAVFCCGPQAFSQQVKQAVDLANSRRVASWSFSPEIFEFSWTKN